MLITLCCLFLMVSSASAAQEASDSPPPIQNEVLEDAPEAPLESVWPTLVDAQFGDLDAMLERGEIRVLTVFTLGTYYIDRGRQRGTVYEASRMLEKFIRKELGAPAARLKVTIIPVRRDQLFAHLIAGHGDVAFANLTVTSERQQIVDFSTPFTSQVRELLVTGPAAPEINSLEDLAGQEIVVPAASSYFENISKMNRRFAADGLEEIHITTSDPRLEIEDILEMLNAGLLPMTVADDHRLNLWSQVFESLEVHDEIAFREDGQNALAMRKNSPQLKALLDKFAKENRVGTLHTNILINQYMKSARWARPALAREPFRRFEQLAGLFRTYGARYDFDWLMLASFAFQESGFDQGARSPVGAIGVMQVMPETAADRAVGIPNIEDLENNIHAGTKYLYVLRGHYFSDDSIDPTERMLFTMAGYNAGPNRINRLRRVAAARGLDPDVWFNNVELVVAAQVGREPIGYVGNIYRYYIAYKRALSALESREAIQTPN